MVQMNVPEMLNVKTMEITSHSRDMNVIELKDSSGKTLFERDGYLPSFLPGGGGDDLRLTVDIDTGMILNWKVTKDAIEGWIENGD